MKTKLETVEDSPSQALAEIENTKKAAYEDGYQKGFDATTASYVEQMPAIQDQIWAACQEACLTKVGVSEDSPFWVENDLPSSRLPNTQDLVGQHEDDVEHQIDDFADAGEDTLAGSKDAHPEQSPIQETANEPINLEENIAGGGSTTEVSTEVPDETPPVVQNLD